MMINNELSYAELQIRRATRQFIVQLGQFGPSQKTPFELSSGVGIALLKLLSQIAPTEVNSRQKMIDIFIQYVDMLLSRTKGDDENEDKEMEKELKAVYQYISTSKGLVKTAGTFNDADLRERIAKQALRLVMQIVKNRNTTSVKEARNIMLYICQSLCQGITEPWNIRYV